MNDRVQEAERWLGLTRGPWLPLGMMAGIFLLSSIPGVPIEDSLLPGLNLAWMAPTLQNTLHVPVYGLLAASWMPWLQRHLRYRAAAALAALLSIGHGVLDEWHQSFVPGRYPSLNDAAADALGALLGIALYTLIRNRRRPDPAGAPEGTASTPD